MLKARNHGSWESRKTRIKEDGSQETMNQRRWKIKVRDIISGTPGTNIRHKSWESWKPRIVEAGKHGNCPCKLSSFGIWSCSLRKHKLESHSDKMLYRKLTLSIEYKLDWFISINFYHTHDDRWPTFWITIWTSSMAE